MEWGAILNVPFAVALLGILVATVTDIRTHEVPDWLSYTLITLGIIFALTHTILFKSWMILFSLIGLAVGYAIGAALYYSGQWGGGDAKLLMGLGALITLPIAWLKEVSVQQLFLLELEVPLFIEFIGWLAICGAAYGLFWMLYLIVRNWKKFRTLFAAKLKDPKLKLLRYFVLGVSSILVLFAIAFSTGFIGNGNLIPGILTLMLAALIYGSFYMIVAVRVAESEFMLKKIKAKQLTEGDWVVGGVKLGKDWIIPEDNIGATKEQITLLLKKAPEKEVVVKEGIPFVPSFLAAIIVAVL